MSYDIYFINLRPGQSWAEAIEELEAATEDADQPVPPELLDAWDRIVPHARELLGEVDLFESGETYELGHDDTGIQLSIFVNEVAITIPYWHTGDKAAQALNQAYALAAVVERETGLQAYDPQVELPLSELPPQHGTAIMSSITNAAREHLASQDAS
ncbi:MAG: hypothetical protein HOV92_45165 [Streptomyces sp.]|nr:hypothetical protein [Streptomyces sp.]